jgi:8-oxo-dGTP pyrophosphatase MutT (NUDIX family)
VTPAFEPFERYARALHPLDRPPAGPGWNLPDLIDLLPGGLAGLCPAAVLVGLVDRGQGLQVVLTRRAEALRHHAGQISFPGGRIEPGDPDPVAAALREAREEIGLQPADARAIGYLDPFVTITGFHVFPVVAIVDSAFAALRDPGEVDEVFELPLDFLMQPGNARELLVDYRGGQRKLVEFVHRDYRVWGATAAMLVNLRQRLEEHP